MHIFSFLSLAVFSYFLSSFAFLVAIMLSKFIWNLVRSTLKLSLSDCMSRKNLRGCLWFTYVIVFISVNIA